MRHRHQLTHKNLSLRTAICSTCGPTDIRVRANGKCQCATAARGYQKKYLLRHPESVWSLSRKLSTQRKLSCGCAHCGYNSFAAALDFHHPDPERKNFEIADAIRTRRIDLVQFVAEMDQCVVLCAICHRLVTVGIIVLQ